MHYIDSILGSCSPVHSSYFKILNSIFDGISRRTCVTNSRLKLRDLHRGRGASWRGMKMLHITLSGSRFSSSWISPNRSIWSIPEWIYGSPNKLGLLQTLAWSSCASYSSSPVKAPHIPLSTGQLLLLQLFQKSHVIISSPRLWISSIHYYHQTMLYTPMQRSRRNTTPRTRTAQTHLREATSTDSTGPAPSSTPQSISLVACIRQPCGAIARSSLEIPIQKP